MKDEQKDLETDEYVFLFVQLKTDVSKHFLRINVIYSVKA